jgi:hypothetical protein
MLPPPPSPPPLQGSKVFCLHFYAMQTIDVPQSASMTRYLEQRDFTRAYQVACLGVPEADWRMLGMEALQVRYRLEAIQRLIPDI